MAAPWSKRLWRRLACLLGDHDWVNEIGELDDPGRPRFICARCGQVSNRTDRTDWFDVGSA
jgi:hypothetical protein